MCATCYGRCVSPFPHPDREVSNTTKDNGKTPFILFCNKIGPNKKLFRIHITHFFMNSKPHQPKPNVIQTVNQTANTPTPPAHETTTEAPLQQNTPPYSLLATRVALTLTPTHLPLVQQHTEVEFKCRQHSQQIYNSSNPQPKQ